MLEEILVHSLFETIPADIAIKDKKIRSIISISNDSVNGKLIKSFLLAMIDEYKDGIVSREKFNEIMEHFVSTNQLQMDSDDDLKQIIRSQLPDACIIYVDEPGMEQEKELGFWKEIKDMEYRLRYGHSFWDRPKNGLLDIKEDPVEYTDEYLKVELEVERLIQKEIGEEVYFGSCHKYWWTKKNILRNKFGIDWKSPEDLNPMVNFD